MSKLDTSFHLQYQVLPQKIDGKRSYHRASNTWLERGVDFFLLQLLEVDIIVKEGVTLDLLSTLNPKTVQGISVQESSQNSAGFRTELLSKSKRIVENLFIHLVNDL